MVTREIPFLAPLLGCECQQVNHLVADLCLQYKFPTERFDEFSYCRDLGIILMLDTGNF